MEEFLDETDDGILKRILSRNVEEPIEDVEDLGVDPVKVYLSKEEYRQLSSVERNQLALDKYWGKRKTKWQIGKEYERYIGYLFESSGWSVSYQGILKRYDDLGRDLICRKEHDTVVIQCKQWRKERKIHENHLFQLFGTATLYRMNHPYEKAVRAYLYTTGELTDIAQEVAKHLGIGIERIPMKRDYPAIKCNVSQRTGEKIYHLPFDQQYDRTVIEQERNECYVSFNP